MFMDATERCLGVLGDRLGMNEYRAHNMINTGFIKYGVMFLILWIDLPAIHYQHQLQGGLPFVSKC
jgi:hypothetical protein